MIKSNSKAAKAAIQEHIKAGFHASDYERYNNTTVNDLPTIAGIILADFDRVTSGDYYLRTMCRQDRFIDWLSGLPSMVDTDYLLGTDAARDLLADWLQETEAEKERFTETEAEQMIGRLLYRELVNAARKEN